MSSDLFLFCSCPQNQAGLRVFSSLSRRPRENRRKRKTAHHFIENTASFSVFSPPSNFMDFMISPKRTGGNPTFSAVVGATTENPFEQKAEVAILPKKLETTPLLTQTAYLVFKRHRQKRRTAGESSPTVSCPLFTRTGVLLLLVPIHLDAFTKPRGDEP